MTNIETKVEFWKELWTDLISNFLKKSYGLNLYSPIILIEDIIVEIEENQFRNAENRKNFHFKISEYLDNDVVIKSHLKAEFTLLRKSFNTKKTNYILSLCKKIDTKLKNGIYFKSTIELTKNLILEDSKLDLVFANKINYYTQSIIVELIKKSFDLEDIKKFLSNIFDNYYYQGDSLVTNYPHNLDYKRYKDSKGKIDSKKFDVDIKAKIDGLNIEARIQTLLYYYNKKAENVKYIFYIRGVKGEIEKEISGVTFYSLNKKRFITDDRLNDSEDLQRNRNKEKYIQAAVNVEYLMPKSSLNKAKTKIENAIDILSCYFKFDTEVLLNESNYAIVNEEGRLIFSSFGRDKHDSFMNYHDSFNLNDIEEHLDSLNEFDFLWKSNQTETTSKIKNALHWYRKGEHSQRDEDKMLNYWIAIENLFNSKEDIKLDIFNNSNKTKFHLIQEIISDQQIFKFIYDFGWELYYYYRNKTDDFNPKKTFPEELLIKAQLKVENGTTIYLKKFIESLPEIRSLETNLFIIEKIDLVINFYNDSQHTKKQILNHISQVQNDILMIYRFRNLIVHNAHFDNTLLPYFIWKTRSYCGDLIRKFIEINKKNKSINEIIFDIYIEKEKFILDFDSGTVNLFKE